MGLFLDLFSIRSLAGDAVTGAKRLLIVIIILIPIIVGCRQVEEVPTLASAAELPTLIVTAVPSLTSTIPPTNTALPTPFVDPTAVEPTLAPTNTATPVVSTREPTPLPPSGVNITFPTEGTEYTLGEELISGGRAQLIESEFISVTLRSATGIRLDQTRAEVNEINNWQATLNVPKSVSGPASIEAAVIDQDNLVKSTDEITVDLRLPADQEGRTIELYRPGFGEVAVNGYYLLFDGWVKQPLNNLVTVSLWNEGCRQQVAIDSFRLNGSGSWWGLLFVPTNLSGRVCASVRFGEPGEDEWREAQSVIEVLAADDRSASGIVIAIPRPAGEIESGKSITIEGLAYNALDGLVTVSVLLDNGRLLTEGVTGVERYGYWDQTLFIPEDANGSAHILASTGSPGDEEYFEISSPITINSGS